MQNPLLGQKIAVLVANGFSEKDFTYLQKEMKNSGAHMRIVSMDQGLVNSWSSEGWGLNFAADQALNRALAVDFDMLVVPGGERSLQKLELTAHTRRFINGFIGANKPVVFYDKALDLFMFSEGAAGITVAGPESVKARAQDAGAIWSEDGVAVDGMIMSGQCTAETREVFTGKVVKFLSGAYEASNAPETVAA